MMTFPRKYAFWLRKRHSFLGGEGRSGSVIARYKAATAAGNVAERTAGMGGGRAEELQWSGPLNCTPQ